MGSDSGAYTGGVVPENLRFLAFPSSCMTVTGDLSELTGLPFSRTVLAPAGRMSLPESYVLNPPSVGHGIPGSWGVCQ
jgi:hypothetical protein